MNAQTLEDSPLGVGTVVRLERDPWLMVNLLTKATDERMRVHPPSPPSEYSSLTTGRLSKTFLMVWAAR